MADAVEVTLVNLLAGANGGQLQHPEGRQFVAMMDQFFEQDVDDVANDVLGLGGRKRHGVQPCRPSPVQRPHAQELPQQFHMTPLTARGVVALQTPGLQRST